MILVPVKNLKNAKQRLSPVLTPDERSRLAEAMLEDVLEALAASPYRDCVSLVTGDSQAQRLAEQQSFAVIDDADEPGETGAIEAATRVCAERGADFTLVLPGDLPLITTAEVEKIFAAAPERGTVLVPSASGRGTNAVFRRPADLFPLSFGNDSFLPHLATAAATGDPVRVLELDGVGMDVDEPADLAGLLACQGATRAQQLLKRLRVLERLEALPVPVPSAGFRKDAT
jgi:2-phospho-L-lactate guanylyltransferase